MPARQDVQGSVEDRLRAGSNPECAVMPEARAVIQGQSHEFGSKRTMAW